MFRRILIIYAVVYFSISLQALTLKESVMEAMETNPIVQERLKNYRATQQDLSIAESEYYPTIDFRAVVGYNEAGNLKNNEGDKAWDHLVQNKSYNNYETSLTLTQNLFDGFATTHKVDYQEARILAAAYNYVEKSNDIAFKMTSAYLDVTRSHELLQTARENVQINDSIYKKVKELFDAGLTTDSEVKKIESSLSLSRSNLTVALNNSRDREYNFRRILGRLPDVAEMEKPNIDVQMPESIERAALYAINHNPSLLVSRYNIKGAQALWKQNKKDFYPTLDLEISQFFNDQDKASTSFDTPDDRFRARLVLNYNIFRGGADSATAQKNISKINQEIEIKRDVKRQVIEGLDLSWNAYELIALQLNDLRDYKTFAEKTLDLYKEEYDLGRRSLLDLLTSQNDVINSRSQIIAAEYALLSAKYRILDAMGILPSAIVGDSNGVAAKVNLYVDSQAEEILDRLPIKLDVDNDNVADNQDLCDNSLAQNGVMPYGCAKIRRDADGDGVFDARDECPLTPAGAKVSPDGCPVDIDTDGIKDYADQCLNTPFGYRVDQNGCANAATLYVNFARDSAVITDDLSGKIAEFALFMKNNPTFKAKIIGHTSRNKNSEKKYNLKLSIDRANSFANELTKLGVDINRFTAQGEGFGKPIADNATEQGRRKNRRVEIELTK